MRSGRAQSYPHLASSSQRLLASIATLLGAGTSFGSAVPTGGRMGRARLTGHH